MKYLELCSLQRLRFDCHWRLFVLHSVFPLFWWHCCTILADIEKYFSQKFLLDVLPFFCFQLYGFSLHFARKIFTTPFANTFSCTQSATRPTLNREETKQSQKKLFFFPFRTHQRKVSQPEGKIFMTEGEKCFSDPSDWSEQDTGGSTFVMKKMWVSAEMTRKPEIVKLFQAFKFEKVFFSWC